MGSVTTKERVIIPVRNGPTDVTMNVRVKTEPRVDTSVTTGTSLHKINLDDVIEACM